MENTQKPSSKLFLHPHHDFSKFSGMQVPFRPEMMQWGIHHSDVPSPVFTVSEEMDYIFRTALTALCSIPPFETTISLKVNEQRKRLILTERTWGRISLNGQSMVTFSHKKYPFDEGSNSIESLIEWPFDVSKGTAEMIKILSSWKVENWLDLFNAKLLERSVFLQEKANKTRGEADAYEVSSNAIIAAISVTK